MRQLHLSFARIWNSQRKEDHSNSQKWASVRKIAPLRRNRSLKPGWGSGAGARTQNNLHNGVGRKGASLPAQGRGCNYQNSAARLLMVYLLLLDAISSLYHNLHKQADLWD